MARLFDDASSEYLRSPLAAAAAPPLTMACWFNTDATTTQTLIGLGYFGSVRRRQWLLLRSAAGGQKIGAQTSDGSSFPVASSTGAYSLNAWQHATAVFESTSKRRAALDGVFGTDETTNMSTGTLDETMIGALRNGSYGITFEMSGHIADAAIWDVALSDAEVRALAAGYSPLCLTHRLKNLVFYQDLIRPLDRPGIGVSLTAAGTSVSAHPGIRMPTGLTLGHLPIVPKVSGPFCVETADAWAPTVVAGQEYSVGTDRGEPVSTGLAAGEVNC